MSFKSFGGRISLKKWRVIYKLEYVCAQNLSAETRQEAIEKVQNLSEDRLLNTPNLPRMQILGVLPARGGTHGKTDCRGEDDPDSGDVPV